MTAISAIIVVKGNPIHIDKTITSINNLVDEIIIVDIGIDNNLSQHLLKNKKVLIKKISKDIPYVELIRETSKEYAKNEYLLFMDPDEVLSEDLIHQLKEKGMDFDYVEIPRKNIIFSKWIQHSRWWPDYQIRFFKRNAVKWSTEIHHQPEVSGKGLRIDAKEQNSIIHYNYQNLDEYMQKALRYAKAEAVELIDSKKQYSLHEAVSRSISEFVSRYFADKGYKDGMHGFVLSFLQMFYSFLVFFYYWEFQKYPNYSEKEIHEASFAFFKKGAYENSYWQIQENLDSSIKNKVKLKILKKL